MSRMIYTKKRVAKYIGDINNFYKKKQLMLLSNFYLICRMYFLICVQSLAYQRKTSVTVLVLIFLIIMKRKDKFEWPKSILQDTISQQCFE